MAHHLSERQPATSAPESIDPQPLPELVPSRRQYLELKGQHPDAILLYRLGDFYETFDEDAALVARTARISLTSRSFGRSGRVPMAGIPHHALNHYLGRLLAAGHSVAIAEQMSPAGKGLVERAVTRVLTPGTVAEPALLSAAENCYLAAVHRYRDRLGLAWLDVSTGEFAVIELDGEDVIPRLAEEVARLAPAECLLPDTIEELDPILERGVLGNTHRTRLERWHFEPARAEVALCRRFAVHSLLPYGCAELPAATGAAGAIVAYLERTNAALLPLLTSLRTETIGSRVGLDAATRRNLELTRSLGTGGSRGSLLGVLDQTRTPMGGRALRRLLTRPLRDLTTLRHRHALVGALVANPGARALLGDHLSAAGDMERLVGQVAYGQAGPRDYLALGDALRAVPRVQEIVERDLANARSGTAEVDADATSSLALNLDDCDDVLALLVRGVDVDQNGIGRIRPGFWPELDAARSGSEETRRWLTTLESRERERTGIRSLKVGFTKVFGYYIEVTRPNLSLVPEEYRRKQTVAVGERYVTAPLKEAEHRLLAAAEETAAHEAAALDQLRTGVLSATDRLRATAASLALLDALLALAEVAAHLGWVTPELNDGDDLLIEGGRHPVVEAGLAGEPFIANDCHLGGGTRQLIVTGPNMGGKSTFLRQTALIVLLAQIGSFVPASRARIGLVDRIFTRVGAQDDLARGQSTFMVEMVETAGILHHATRRSLLVLDEIGRGTGTADGLAIARAVFEDINGRIDARTLFATHYLELTTLTTELPGVANAHVAALERDGRVVFLYAVRDGAADRAYGIHVARLAGLPPWVADRADSILGGLAENGSPSSSSAPPSVILPAPQSRSEIAASPRDALVADATGTRYESRPAARLQNRGNTDGLARELSQLDLDALTPKRALDWLYEQRCRLLTDCGRGTSDDIWETQADADH